MTDGSIAVIGILLGLVSGIVGYLLVSRPAAMRALRVERSQAYLQLEIASIDTFRFRAEYAYAIQWSLTGSNPKRLNTGMLAEQVDQYYFQCLNLFEVASRFRKAKIIAPEIYASWVAWFFEALEVRYFRENWQDNYHDNYTRELQRIFDGGIALFEHYGLRNYNSGSEENDHPDDIKEKLQAARDAFYRHVAWVVPCAMIGEWLAQSDQSSSDDRLAHRFYRRRHKLSSPQTDIDMIADKA
ncbi:hypothetical protein [Aurantiacibacter zhengii]|nr:hypothetical protein [Aurantiacibacter zhengii]